MKNPETMTDEELRIEIAEFCGWKFISIREAQKMIPYWPLECSFMNPDGNPRTWDALPNYPKNLDAMWEARQKLKGIQETIYYNILLQVCGCVNACIDATAKQRALAFVETIREIKK